MVDNVYDIQLPRITALPLTAGSRQPVNTPEKATEFRDHLLNELYEPNALRQASLNTKLENAKASLSAEKRTEIEEAAQQLESLVLYMLMKQMWATLPEDTLFENGLASKFFREMWLEEISDTIAKQESSIGLADVVERELVLLEANTVSPQELAGKA